MDKRIVLASAFAAVVTVPIAVMAQSTTPQPVTPPTAFTVEQCYGIAERGQNDCASTGNNSCGGTSLLDGDPNAWIYMPTGYCDRIVGGSLTPGGRGAVLRGS